MKHFNLLYMSLIPNGLIKISSADCLIISLSTFFRLLFHASMSPSFPLWNPFFPPSLSSSFSSYFLILFYHLWFYFTHLPSSFSLSSRAFDYHFLDFSILQTLYTPALHPSLTCFSSSSKVSFNLFSCPAYTLFPSLIFLLFFLSVWFDPRNFNEEANSDLFSWLHFMQAKQQRADSLMKRYVFA